MHNSWHIEATSKCTLDCPLCDRTWFYKTFKKRLLHEINIDHLDYFFSKTKYARVSLCGNNGDPIYHSKFHSLCETLKKNNCEIHITTNGSARSTNWWRELGVVLTENDSITFSIDGLEDTNHIYRKNADWDSIIKGIEILENESTVPKCWKFIVFDHNQHQIDQAKQLSQKLGFVEFRIEHSDRWLPEESNTFKPAAQFIDPKIEQQKKVIADPDYFVEIDPFCIKNNKPSNQIYIDAEGYFYPCCWMASYRYKMKSIFSPKALGLNIKGITEDDIFKNKEVINFFKDIRKKPNECCKLKCGKQK